MAYAKRYGHTIGDRTTNSILVIVLPRSFAQAMVDGESGFTGYLPAAPDTPILIVCESFRVFSLDRLAWIPTERKWLTFDLAVTRVFPENPRAPTIQRVSVSLER